MKTCKATKRTVLYAQDNENSVKIATYKKGETIGTFHEGDTQHRPFSIITNAFKNGIVIQPRVVGFVLTANITANPEPAPKTAEQMAAEAQARAIEIANKQAADFVANAQKAEAERVARQAQENIAMWRGDSIVSQRPMPKGSVIYDNWFNAEIMATVLNDTGFVLIVRNPTTLTEKNGLIRVRFYPKDIGILPNSLQPMEGWIKA